jgi:hypothetical protein
MRWWSEPGSLFDTRFAHRVSYSMHAQVRHLRAVLLYDDAEVWVARANLPYPPGWIGWVSFFGFDSHLIRP